MFVILVARSIISGKVKFLFQFSLANIAKIRVKNKCGHLSID